MKTYTFILDYREGTYISQHDAIDLSKALKLWARSLNIQEIKYLGEKSWKEIENLVLEETPTPIRNMKNVWCLSIGISTGFMILNIVQTEIDK